jgi:hypothetical protein
MIARLYGLLVRTRARHWLVPTVLLFAVCCGAFTWRSRWLAGTVPDARRCGYTPEELVEYLHGIDDLRWLYALTEVTLDMLFPLVYGGLLGWLVVWLWSAPRAELLLGFLLAGVVADWAENVTLAVLTWTCDSAAATAWQVTAQLASALTVLKSTALGAVILGVAAGLIGRVLALL